MSWDRITPLSAYKCLDCIEGTAIDLESPKQHGTKVAEGACLPLPLYLGMKYFSRHYAADRASILRGEMK